MCFISILMHYWKKNINKVASSSTLKMVIYKQGLTFLLFPVKPEVVLLLAKMTSHYYGLKMNIKAQNMHQPCLLIIRTYVCDSFI